MKKRVEVKLSLPVVAPLLDVIRELSFELEKRLAAPQALHDLDQEFRGAWIGELLEGQNGDLRALLALFDGDFFTEGVVAFDETNAEPIVRACTAYPPAAAGAQAEVAERRGAGDRRRRHGGPRRSPSARPSCATSSSRPCRSSSSSTWTSSSVES